MRNELFDSFSFSVITIANCNNIYVKSRAFAGLQALQQISVANHLQLILEEQAFSWTSVSENTDHHNGILVNISNCHIPQIPSYCFQGDLKTIVLSSVNVSIIKSYGFSSIDNAERMDFNRVNVANVQNQAFKRFSVGFLAFVNSQFTVLPTRAMMDISVLEEVRFERIKVDRIETNSLEVSFSRNFRIIESLFGYMEKTSIKTQTRGDVSIHDNTFLGLEEDAFVGFTVDKKYFQEAGKQDLIFENNTLTRVESGALTFNTSAFDPRLDWVKINQTCSCDNAYLWANDLVYLSPNPSTKTSVPKINIVIYCLNPKYTRLRDFQNTCDVTKSSLLVIVLICLGVGLVILSVAVGIFLVIRNRGKRYINVPTSATGLRAASSHKGHMLVVPDGKTYRETELQVIVEHAEPIVPLDFVRERPDRENGV